MNKLENKERTHKWHWSSTEVSSSIAWYQSFDGGYQNYNLKTISLWTQAVRRVKK